MGEKGTAYLVTRPGDERSRQLRHSYETKTPTPITWTGMGGGDQVTWGLPIECREYLHEGEKLEEWVMEVR